MPENRPAIPKSVEREVLVESGHRCAVCCEPTPLERAHIVPWSQKKEHAPENLICLCANCHHRADNEKWGAETLREYKQKPCVTRRFNTEAIQHESSVQVEILFETTMESFVEDWERLAAGVECMSEMPPKSLRIRAVIKKSVLAILEMPAEAAKKLLQLVDDRDEVLQQIFYPHIIIEARMKEISYIGTIVGESTTNEFRLAIAAASTKEQDIIAVDSLGMDDLAQPVRVWAKIQSIERINPLFPQEAGHELAETRTNPFDTVLSLSREMVTAECKVLGFETIGNGKGRLDQLRYPPKPATMAYLPDSEDVQRIVIGDLNDPKKQNRALDLATLANRADVDVMVDGHSIVLRHLAILAMTGAGKSVTARRIIEELAKKNYPIVIFDPHGDYTGLADVPALRGKVQRFYAEFPLFEEDSETVAEIVSSLGYELNPNMRTVFADVFAVAKDYVGFEKDEMAVRDEWLANFLNSPKIKSKGFNRDLWLVANLAEAAELSIRKKDKKSTQLSEAQQMLAEWGWERIGNYSGTDAKTLEAIKKRVRRAASVLWRMELANKKVAPSATALPTDRRELVKFGQISVVSLAGYTGDFQATIYSLIANEIFGAKIDGDLELPVLFLLEEAHNFVPAHGTTTAEIRSIETTKQIAQEGRKFGVGLILVSQRPSRLDETTLSQCNSFVIMRMVNPADQNFVRRVVESLGEDEAKNLPNLDVGEALLSGQMINFPVLVKIKEPESKGEREEKDAFVVLEEAHQAELRSKR